MYNLLRIFILLTLCSMSHAASLFLPQTDSLDIRLEARYANSLYNLSHERSHRLTTELTYKSKWHQWSTVVEGRGRAEGAFGANPDRYNSTYTKQNSSEFFVRDLYAQYFSGPLLMRFGYQQVVWGEAFGYYYSDIINPKDLRELGLGDLDSNRLQIPMIDLKYLHSASSFEFVAIPKPGFNKLPEPGSDYFISPTSTVSPDLLKIGNEPKISEMEFAARGKVLFGKFDLSLFTFNGYDRNPIYRIDLTSNPGFVTLQPDHYKSVIYGSTFSWDLGSILLRGESLLHQKRKTQTLAGASLSYREADNFIGVLGADFPEISWFQLGVQISRDSLSSHSNEDLRPKNLDLLSIRIAKDWKQGYGFQTLYNVYLNKPSSYLQFQFNQNITRRTVAQFAFDIFEGKANSQFGVYHDASRVLASIKIYDSR